MHSLPSELPVIRSRRLKQAEKACPLLEGEEEAWIACCSKRFLPLARRIAGDSELALDALQESWIKIIGHVQGYRGQSPACAWAGTIVANSATDILRTRIRGRKVQQGLAKMAKRAADKTPERLAEERQMVLLLRGMVVALPGMYRQVVEMRYFQFLSTAETAEQLHISRSNVSTRLNRAVAMLRKRLDARLGVQNAGAWTGRRENL